MPDKEIVLKPCPFCGGGILECKEHHEEWAGGLEDEGHYVECVTCWARGAEGKTPGSAIMLWNCRHE